MVSPPGLQNDHKALMKQVEEALHQLHAREKEKRARDEAEALAEAMSQSQPQAFARVNAVTPGSPASISVSWGVWQPIRKLLLDLERKHSRWLSLSLVSKLGG